MTSKEVDVAKAICAQCPARSDCLLWSLHEGEGWGVWGGYTKPERTRALEYYDGDVEAVVLSLAAGMLDDVVAPPPIPMQAS